MIEKKRASVTALVFHLVANFRFLNISIDISKKNGEVENIYAICGGICDQMGDKSNYLIMGGDFNKDPSDIKFGPVIQFALDRGSKHLP
jgi:hypothetical protein